MGEFNVVVWKVEHGSAAFVRTPNGRTLAFDAGASSEFSPAKHLSASYGLDSYSNRLDYLFVSHPHSDHLTDLPTVYESLRPKVLSRNKSCPDDKVYKDGTDNLSEPFKTWKKMNDEYIHPVSGYEALTPDSNWEGVHFSTYCIEPEQLSDAGKGEGHLLNNLSLCVLVRYRDVEVFFPGDLEPAGWDALIDNTSVLDDVGGSDKSLRVLVASHHGRASGIRNTDRTVYTRFLDAMKPHLVLISDKYGNDTTDPDAYRPHALGAKVYCKATESLEDKKVVTTKTNDYVRVNHDTTAPLVIMP